MGKSYRFNPDDDWDTQMSSKERKRLRKKDKFARQAIAKKTEIDDGSSEES